MPEKEDTTRHLRLLSQFAADRIEDVLDHDNPPREIYDMTTWRLERPDNLLEVIEGVLADPILKEKWPTWKAFKHTIDREAMPAWISGQDAYAFCAKEGNLPAKLKSQFDADPADYGMRVALAARGNSSAGMWFYEGWLTALDEDEEGDNKAPGPSNQPPKYSLNIHQQCDQRSRC